MLRQMAGKTSKKGTSGKRKPAKKKRAAKRLYSFRELKIPDQSTFEEYLIYLSEHPDLADKHLRGNEEWAISIFGHNTYSTFSTAELFGPNGYMARYQSLMNAAQNPEKMEQLLDGIKIVKVGTARQSTEKIEAEYKVKREAEKKHMEEVTEAARKIFAPKEKHPSKGTLLEKALEHLVKMEKKMKALDRKLKKLEKGEKKNDKSKTAKKSGTKTRTASVRKAGKGNKQKPTKKQTAKKGGSKSKSKSKSVSKNTGGKKRMVGKTTKRRA